VNVFVDTNLSWTGGDPDGDTVTYDIYYSNAFPPILRVSNYSQTSWNPGHILYNMTYMWRIIAKDSRGAISESPIWYYTTENIICGDTNDDKTIDISDVVYLISYIFQGGLPPLPYCSADVNDDNVVDVSDAVYLISYIFQDGPPPIQGCCGIVN
jgi:hypothetical protein